MNKDLILREKLAIQRTHLANQTTLLAFIRTALYFFVAGLSIDSFFSFSSTHLVMWVFFCISLLLILLGTVFFVKNRKLIRGKELHVGNIKLEFLEGKES